VSSNYLSSANVNAVLGDKHGLPPMGEAKGQLLHYYHVMLGSELPPYEGSWSGEDHARTFYAHVNITDLVKASGKASHILAEKGGKVICSGQGGKKTEAEGYASLLALKWLKDWGIEAVPTRGPTVQVVPGVTENPKVLLNEFYHQHYQRDPHYTVTRETTGTGGGIFVANVSVAEETFTGRGFSKAKATQAAAALALEYLRERHSKRYNIH